MLGGGAVRAPAWKISSFFAVSHEDKTADAENEGERIRIG